MTDTPARLVRLAQQLEDQHAPQHMTILMREAAKEMERMETGLWDVHAYCNNWDWFIWMWPIRRIKRIARAALGEKA